MFTDTLRMSKTSGLHRHLLWPVIILAGILALGHAQEAPPLPVQPPLPPIPPQPPSGNFAAPFPCLQMNPSQTNLRRTKQPPIRWPALTQNFAPGD